MHTQTLESALAWSRFNVPLDRNSRLAWTCGRRGGSPCSAWHWTSWPASRGASSWRFPGRRVSCLQWEANVLCSQNSNKSHRLLHRLLRHSPSCSSILSHSSNTKCLMFFRLRILLSISARVRPGVPTTMCGQFFFSTSSSFFMAMPPKNTDTLTVGMYLEKRSYSLLIWKANSRVWHMTSTDT